jgi:hypothetical protein
MHGDAKKDVLNCYHNRFLVTAGGFSDEVCQHRGDCIPLTQLGTAVKCLQQSKFMPIIFINNCWSPNAAV